MVTMIKNHPRTLETTLLAYRQLFAGNIREALPGLYLTTEGLDVLRAEKHRLLCRLANVQEGDPDPLAHICQGGMAHVWRWRIDARAERVMCPICSQ
ncbi:MAG TPA: hypothetical protein VH540_27260 [Ktedonobacterales bacterium]|jgi:hypothetical protein